LKQNTMPTDCAAVHITKGLTTVHCKCLHTFMQVGDAVPSTRASCPSSRACASSPPHRRTGDRSCTPVPSHTPSCGRRHMACKCPKHAPLSLEMAAPPRQAHLPVLIEPCPGKGPVLQHLLPHSHEPPESCQEMTASAPQETLLCALREPQPVLLGTIHRKVVAFAERDGRAVGDMVS